MVSGGSYTISLDELSITYLPSINKRVETIYYLLEGKIKKPVAYVENPVSGNPIITLVRPISEEDIEKALEALSHIQEYTLGAIQLGPLEREIRSEISLVEIDLASILNSGFNYFNFVKF
ncbi:hypothetical protein KY358_00570 [Candidatus Woesearchaeota archaeon]|nr:hypothetical protein [Candidatus Woesearchaeota archaeon]